MIYTKIKLNEELQKLFSELLLSEEGRRNGAIDEIVFTCKDNVAEDFLLDTLELDAVNVKFFMGQRDDDGSEPVPTQADRLRRERNEARDLVRRALELASPVEHPEQWIEYRAACLKADDSWEDNDR